MLVLWGITQVKNKNVLNIFRILSLTTLLTVNLIPTIAYGNTNRWQYKRYRVPDVGAPKRTETQGSRGDCPIITPIMPQISNPQSRKYSFGTTISEYPTLFFHIGKHSQRSLSFPAKFLLKDEQNNTLYRQDFQLPADCPPTDGH